MRSNTSLIKLLASAVLVALSLPLSAVGDSEMSSEARRYLLEALDIMQANSVHREEVDWETLRRKTMQEADGAQLPVDTYDAIRFALNGLGDNHSFLQLVPELAEKEKAREAARLTVDEKKAEREVKRITSPFRKRRKAESHLHRTDRCVVAQIVVPRFSSSKVDAFATELQSMIADADAKEPCGWIVDLRGNTGGNVYPMLAGIGPLVGEGDLAFASGAEGEQTIFFYQAGTGGVIEPDGTRIKGATVRMPPHQLRHPGPIAVLIDNGTASSGEFVAIALRSLSEARFFGEKSFGVSTSNQGFRLSDGANIVLTTAIGRDSSGRMYPAGLEPDEVIATQEAIPFSAADDAAVQAALRWIAKVSNET